jgi:diadenosine tetraphosphatase ApaH/serine/threonine PP2A family protein phosphatase
VTAVALISDLHSNREALEAVFARIDQLGVQEVCCLGDVVGYGADPEHCTKMVMERCKWTIMGNHDWGVFHQLDDFNPLAREALLFTRRRLKPGLLSRRRSSMWVFLRDLPTRMEDHGHVYCHGSPRDPIMEYVLKSDGFLEPEKMAQIFEMLDRPCFVGHTHWPGVHGPDFRFTQATEEHRRIELRGEPVVVNVGSVGQPRDGDNRACFAVVADGQVEFHRVPYDIASAQRKIVAAGLHPALAERLGRGK